MSSPFRYLKLILISHNGERPLVEVSLVASGDGLFGVVSHFLGSAILSLAYKLLVSQESLVEQE